QNLHVPPADGLDVEEAVGVDVLHHETDLVAVPGEHDSRRAVPVFCEPRGKDVTVRIGAQLVRYRPHALAHDLLDLLFEPGRAGRLQERLQELVRRMLHWFSNEETKTTDYTDNTD